jgi:uncharacterized protein
MMFEARFCPTPNIVGSHDDKAFKNPHCAECNHHQEIHMGLALITGASSGLGLDFADLFAKDGHSLILVARRKDLLEQVATRLRSTYPKIQVDIVDMDLGSAGAGRALFDKVKSKNLSVDYLVNNAGFGNSGSFKDQPLNKELQMIDLNVRAVVQLAHLFLPDMLKKKSGRILNVGSTAGFQPGPYMSTYYATKAFVNSFSEGLHEELKGKGVTCTVLAPGATATGFASAANMNNSRLFKSGSVATSKQVARFGYNSMLAGRTIVVPGLLNNLMIQMLRLSPRFMVRKVASFVNRSVH